MAQAIRTKSRTTSAGSTETADDPDNDTKRISSAKKSGSKLSAKQRRSVHYHLVLSLLLLVSNFLIEFNTIGNWRLNHLQ